jgi:hypothetical protein
MEINGVSVQSPLLSGTNIKKVNNASILASGNYNVPSLGVMKLCKIIPTEGTQITSTTNSITYSILIPANTFTSKGIIDFGCRLGHTGGTASTWQIRIYTNTSNTLTGATLIAVIANVAGNQIYIQGFRYFRLQSGNLYFFSTAIQASTDQQAYTSAEGSTTFSLSSDNYILVAIQKGTANSEICKGLFCKAIGYE